VVGGWRQLAAPVSRVAEEADLDFGYGRADDTLADVDPGEERSRPDRFRRKGTTQHSLDNVDIGAAAIQCTVAVTLSPLYKCHKSKRSTPRAADCSARAWGAPASGRTQSNLLEESVLRD
jgi:hypothetical protein